VNLFPRSAVRPVRALFAITLLATALLFASEHTNAQQSASVAIAVKDHRFQPSQISAPANRPISIRVKNLDSAPMEFESVSLRVEKVIAPGSEGVAISGRWRPAVMNSSTTFTSRRAACWWWSDRAPSLPISLVKSR
jgi:hypothetical protein